MKSKIISIVLLAMLLASTAAVFPIKADVADVEFYIDPALSQYNTGTTSVGFRFNVTVKWRDHAPLVQVLAWQIGLLIDTSQLNCTRAWQPGWDANYLLYPAGPANYVHPAPTGLGTGDISIMGSIQAPGTAVSDDDALLAIFELQIIAAPGKYEDLTSDLTFNSAETIWSPDATLWFDPIKTIGHYEYDWTLPPAPHLAVSPTSTVYGPAPPPAVGETFNVQVTLKALDAAWNLHNASFRLTYDCANPLPAEIIAVTSITVDPYWTTSTVDNTTTVGTIDVFVTKTPPPSTSGDHLIITIGFIVIYQGPYGENHNAPLALSQIVLWDTLNIIQTSGDVNGNVVVNGLQTLAFPWLEVSNATLGPEPMVTLGAEVNVTVSVKGLDALWFFIGLDFRLAYDPAILQPVTAYEGPFLPYYASLQPGSLGTFWIYMFDTLPQENVLVGNLIYPDGLGRWHYPFPEGDGVVATITFRCLVDQSFGEPDFTSYLNIIEQDWVGLDNPDGAQNIVDVPYAPPVNGIFTVSTSWPGRTIDLYTQYPAPFGGQGFNANSDMFWPQKQVELYANVTYNYWPVQQKDVAFEVRDPHGNVVTVQVARTDANGVAHTWYRIPWPCDHPEDNFGVWTVIATVDLACIVITDTLHFHFDYMVELFKVTAEKFQVNHYECFTVFVEYQSHLQQYHDITFQVILYDNLSVPVAQYYVTIPVGGTIYCQRKAGNFTALLCIPKYAFAGIASIYVNAYENYLPIAGGNAVTPTYGLMNPFGYSWADAQAWDHSMVPLIAIQPK